MKRWFGKAAVWGLLLVLCMHAPALAEQRIIEEEAFYGTTSLQKVVVPAGTTEIRSKAFAGSSMAEITLPNGLQKIGDAAFQDCLRLEKVRLPRSCAELGKGVFQGCTALKEVRILNQMKVIREAAFADCSSLTEIQLPQSVVSIEGAAFKGCTALKQINLPESLTFIETNAFEGCPDVVATVDENSYALEWCIKNHIEYVVEEDWGAGEFSV